MQHEGGAPLTEHMVSTPVTTADQDAYRALAAESAKSVAIITTVAHGWDHAVPVTDFLSVTYDPPTMLVSLYGLSRMAEAVEESGVWALSLLEASQRSVADRLSMEGGPLGGLLGQTPHHRRAPGEPVIIAGAITWFQLRTIAQHEAATHTLFVGEVTAMGTANTLDARPLVRVRNDFLR